MSESMCVVLETCRAHQPTRGTFFTGPLEAAKRDRLYRKMVEKARGKIGQKLDAEALANRVL